MGRRRKAWLENGTGVRIINGKRMPGYYVRWHEYANGVRRSPSRKFSTKQLADAFIRRYNAMTELRMLGQVVQMPLDQAVQEFFHGITTLAAQTRVDYTTALAYLSATVGECNVCEITSADIDRFIATRSVESTQATVAKHLRALRRFFLWSIKRGYMATNPILDATTRPTDVHVRERPVVTEEQVAALIAQLNTEDRRLAVWLAMTTGLDRGVIEALCTAQVDTAGRCIRIQRPKTKRQSRPKRLIIPIHEQLVPLLFSRLRDSDPYRPLLSGLQRQGDRTDWWKVATAAAGVPDLWFRDLRAVFSALGQRVGGLTLPQIQRQLGHSDPQVTANWYEMADPDMHAKVNRLPLPGFARIAARSAASPETPHDAGPHRPSTPAPDAQP